MRVGYMRPIRNPINPSSVLMRDCVPDIGELAVLENEKVVLFCERGECRGEFWDGERRVRGEGQNVNVCFYEADFGGERADDIEDFGGGGHVDGETEVGALAGDDGQEVPADYGGVGSSAGGVGFGGHGWR